MLRPASHLVTYDGSQDDADGKDRNVKPMIALRRPHAVIWRFKGVLGRFQVVRHTDTPSPLATITSEKGIRFNPRKWGEVGAASRSVGALWGGTYQSGGI